MQNHNTYQLIPNLRQTNKGFGNYTSFSKFWACFNPLLKECGPGRSETYFLSKDVQSQYRSVDTKVMSKQTKISEVIHILVIFGRVFNPLLRGCGRGQNFFLSKRGTATIPIS